MTWLADWFARRIWWGMLWLMRRPPIRRAQRASLGLVPERYRSRAEENFKRQEIFARKIGLPLIRLCVLLLMLSVLVTVAFRLVLLLLANGGLEAIGRLREAAER